MKKGITIIEIVIWMALFVIISGTALFVINPAGQISKARNNQRQFHLNAILNSIRQNMADTSGGKFTCASGAIPTSTKKMAVGAGNYDIGPCIVPAYLINMPYDPGTTAAHYISVADYDTGYNIFQSATTGEITISAPAAELNQTISVVR